MNLLRMIAALAFAGSSVTLMNCKTATLSNEGAAIENATAPPPATCRSLGPVTGRGGGSFGGGWVSNENLIEYAMNDMRNKAAEMGANYVHYAGNPTLGSSEGTTSTATVTGTAYRCPPGAEAEEGSMPVAAEGTAPAKSSGPKPPIGAAGFDFGDSVVDAEAACTEAGHEWTGDDGRFRCSGPAARMGLDPNVVLQFCGESLCAVVLLFNPGSPESGPWVSAYADLKRALKKKYGKAASTKESVPQYCKGPEFKECLETNRVLLQSLWRWSEGHRVQMRMGTPAKGGGDPAIRLTYISPQLRADAAAKKGRPTGEGL